MTEVTPAIHRLRRVAPLALVVVLATACGDDNKGTATPKEPEPPPLSATTGSGDTTPQPTVPTGSAKAGKPSLLMGKRNLLLLLEGDIRGFAPTQVEGKFLQVVALAGPTAFWAGRKTNQRILVKMRLKGGRPPKVKVGQRVDFVGVLTVSGDDPSLGVSNDADKELLAKQGAYVDASAADVTLR